MARAPVTAETRSVRLLKVGEQVRHMLAELLTRGQVHDELLAAHTVSITQVRMSPDLRIATVFAKPLLGVDEEAVLKALRTHTAFFQREVGQRLKLRSVPKLRFQSDDSFDEALRIDRLLADPKVARDLSPRDIADE